MAEIPAPIDVEAVTAFNELEDVEYTDWHAVVSLVFGDTIESGMDWGRNEWSVAGYGMSAEVEDAIRERINKKIELNFFFLELGTLPFKRFSMNMVRTLNNVMATLGPKYTAIANGIVLTETGKTTKVASTQGSDFPQSALAPTEQDYATNRSDSAEEVSGTISLLELFERSAAFVDPDSIMLEAVRDCFSNRYSFNA